MDRHYQERVCQWLWQLLRVIEAQSLSNVARAWWSLLRHMKLSSDKTVIEAAYFDKVLTVRLERSDNKSTLITYKSPLKRKHKSESSRQNRPARNKHKKLSHRIFSLVTRDRKTWSSRALKKSLKNKNGIQSPPWQKLIVDRVTGN